MSEIDEIRARILAAPTSSAGDPPWLADAKVLLAALDATSEREKRLVEAARVAKEKLELFVEFAVRQCEFEGDGQAGRDAVNSLTRALEAYRDD